MSANFTYEMDESFDPTLPYKKLPINKVKVEKNKQDFGKIKTDGWDDKPDDDFGKIKNQDKNKDNKKAS